MRVIALLLATISAAPLEASRSDLLSKDAATAVAAAHKLGAARRADVLIEALALGAPPEVAGAILDALAACKSPQADATFLRYADHRNPELRRKALAGLGASRDPRAGRRLLEAVGDQDPGVRALAARLVAERGEAGAEERLMGLLRRGDAGAARPLGSIASPALIRQLSGMVGSVPDAVLAQALGEILKRRDVPDSLRVELVGSLAGITGPEATAALSEYLASVPEGEDRPSKTAAQKAIDRRGAAR